MMQEVLYNILKSRIRREKATGTLNKEEMKNTINILLAGGSIAAEQYTELIEMINPTIQNTVS